MRVWPCTCLANLRKVYVPGGNRCGAADYSTHTPEPAPHELMRKFMAMMELEWDSRPGKKVRSSPPSTQEELPGRCMQDSFSTIVFPLSSNRVLRKKYATPSGSVRSGCLMEDMDVFAAWTTLQHMCLPTVKPGNIYPYTFPTALVDRIDFTDYTPKTDVDISYHGHVSWVGRSSCEVLIWLEQDVGAGSYQTIAQAVFVMVVREFASFAPGFINKLVPKDDRERKLLAEAEARREQRARLASSSLLKTAPSPTEQSLLHELFLQSVQPGSSVLSSTLPPGSTWLGDTTHISAAVTHAEDLNTNSRVFGGVILRHALEASETCARLYSKQQPKICHAGNIHFFKGIEAGAVISLHSQVVFTQHNYLQIATRAEVLDAVCGRPAVTNIFHYTFKVPKAVPSIMPHTYTEAMKYLDGRRHFMHVMDRDKTVIKCSQHV